MPNRLQHAIRHCVRLKKSRIAFEGIKADKVGSLIYFIRAGDYVKVGLSSHWMFRARVASIQTGNPHKVQVLRVIKSRRPRFDEKRMHNALRQYHARGEWFLIDQERMALFLAGLPESFD